MTTMSESLDGSIPLKIGDGAWLHLCDRSRHD